MTDEKKDKIIQTIKETCKEYDNQNKYYDSLKEMYNHLKKYINEPTEQRKYTIKKIIDSNFEEEKK
jgi:hypothetical protein